MVSKLWQNYSFSSTNSKIILFEGIIYLGYFFFVMKNKITFWYGIYCGTLSLRKVTVLPPMDGKYGSGPGFARFWRIGDQFLALAGATELASLRGVRMGEFWMYIRPISNMRTNFLCMGVFYVLYLFI